MAVTFDALGPSSSGQVSTASPTTWSHTNAGNCIVVIANWTSGGSSSITAVSYGGTSLSRIAQVAGGGGTAGGCDVWGVISGSLPTGANTVSVTGGGPSGTNHVCAGSISLAGAGSFGTPVTNSATGGTLSATVANTVTGGIIVAGATFGGSFVTATASSPGTLRFSALGDSNGGADQTFGQTCTSPGGSQAVGFTWSSGSDFIGLVAVEVQPPAAAAVLPPPPQPGMPPGRRSPMSIPVSWTRPPPAPAAPGPVTWTGAAALSGTGTLGPAPTIGYSAALSGTGTLSASAVRYIAGLGGTGAGYFKDNNGKPRMWLGDEIWALLTNAGRWNSGNYQATFDAYFSTRAAQGFTVCYSDMFNSTLIGGAANGQMWNGQTPFTSNNPSSGLNNTYWQVIDYALASALANGITLALSFGGHWDWDTSGNAMFGFTGTQYQAAGNAIGTRYASQPNILWLIMDDYFGSFDSSLSSLLTGLRASGDTHPIAIENYPETSSRFDLSNNTSLTWGASNTQFNFGYSYGQTYLSVEYMFAESSPLTPIYGDGYFYQGSSTYNGGNAESSGSAFDHAMRQDAWWAIASGARGWNIGDEALWQWASTAPASVSTQWFAANNAGAIRAFMESLPDWHTLAPATGSTLITAGRGTRGTQPSSGGGGGQYEIAFTNAYVAASRTPDSGSGSSLAVFYFPTGAGTITIDQTKIATGYTATWVDPVTCATTSGTTGSTYNPSTPGTNSRGGSDWVLVLQAPPVKTGAAALSGSGTLGPAVTLGFSASLAGTGTITESVLLGFSASLTGTGTMAAAGVLAGSAALSGSGQMTIAALLGFSAALSGTGTLAGSAVFAAAAVLSGSGVISETVRLGFSAALSGSGLIGETVTLGYSAVLAGSGTLSLAPLLGFSAALAGAGTMSIPGEVLGYSSALSGTGALTATGTIPGGPRQGAAVLSGSGLLVPSVTLGYSAALAGTGILAPSLVLGYSAHLSGTGTLAGAAVLAGGAALSGAGVLTASGVLFLPAAAVLSGSGTMSAGPARALHGAAALAGLGVLAASAAHITPVLLSVIFAASPLAPRWQAGPFPPRWAAAPMPSRWSARIMPFHPIAAISVEYIPVLWTAELVGDNTDPTGQTAGQPQLPVQFAVPLSSGNPAAPAEPAVWYTATWLTAADVTVAGYVALCPVGPTGGSPAGQVQLTAGLTYDVWSKITGSTEAPAKFAGQQPVY